MIFKGQKEPSPNLGKEGDVYIRKADDKNQITREVKFNVDEIFQNNNCKNEEYKWAAVVQISVAICIAAIWITYIICR